MVERRKLGYIEALLLASLQTSNSGTIVTSAEIEGEIDEEIMVAALEVMFERHPSLRSLILHEGKDYYLETSAQFENIPISFGDRKGKSIPKVIESEMDKPLDPACYLWRMTCLLDKKAKGKKKHMLLFSCHHTVSDGASTCMFIRDLIDVYEKLERNIDYEEDSLPLLDPIEEMCNNNKTIEEFEREKEEVLSHKIDQFPYDEEVALEKRSTKVQLIQMQKEELNQLHMACKENKVTINSALNAAALLAMSELFGSSITFSTYSPMSLRKDCIPALGNEHFGFFVGYAMNVFDVDAKSSDFFDLALEYQKAFYREKEIQCFMPDKLPSTTEDLLSQLNDFQTTDSAKFQLGLCVTNLGNYCHKAQLKTHVIKSLNFSVCRTAGDLPFLIQVVTLEGVMHVSVVWTDPLMSKEHAQLFCARMMHHLEMAAQSLEKAEKAS